VVNRENLIYILFFSLL